MLQTDWHEISMETIIFPEMKMDSLTALVATVKRFASFFLVYEGRDQTVLQRFSGIPLPNWDVKYTSLMKLKWFQKKIQAFSLQHGYR
jgi:cell surface protein SprA